MTARRAFLAAGGGLFLLVSSRAALAQQAAKVWRVGFLSARRRPDSLKLDYYGAFPERMRELGYVEGKNLAIEWRFAEGKYEQLSGMAAELVRLKVDVMMALGPPAVAAARKATDAIPIVIVTSIDPVEAGFVKSLARPGGNVTGLSNLAGDISSKHLELLLAMAPKLSRVTVLVNPANAAHEIILKNVQAAARAASIRAASAKAHTPQEIEGAFSTMGRDGGAVIVALDPFFIQQERQIAELAVKHRLPSIFANREYVEAGGLMSYGQNQIEIYRRAAEYVDRIFKGARPGELPVEQPTTLELVINRKTAKAIGLAIPQDLLVRADKLIE